MNNTNHSSKYPTPKRNTHLNHTMRYLNSSKDNIFENEDYNSKKCEYGDVKREEVDLRLKVSGINNFSSPYRKDDKSGSTNMRLSPNDSKEYNKFTDAKFSSKFG